MTLNKVINTASISPKLNDKLSMIPPSFWYNKSRGPRTEVFIMGHALPQIACQVGSIWGQGTVSLF